MDTPLVIHGPSSTYATTYYGVGKDLVAIDTTHSDKPLKMPPIHFYPKSERTLFQKLIGLFRHHSTPSASATETFELCRNQCWNQHSLSHRFRTLITRIPSHHSVKQLYVNQLTLFRSSIRAQNKELPNESNTKTTRSHRSYPTVEVRKRRFPNNARNCSRIGGQQGNDIRTHRSTHTKGRTDKRTKQSSLFIDC